MSDDKRDDELDNKEENPGVYSEPVPDESADTEDPFDDTPKSGIVDEDDFGDPPGTEKKPYDKGTPIDFVEELPVSEELKKPLDRNDPAITIIRESFDRIGDVLERQNELLKQLGEQFGQGAANTEEKLWFRTFRDFLATSEVDKLGVESSKRDGSQWRQSVEYEGQNLRPSFPRAKAGAGSANANLAFVERALNMGSPIDVPLWHSGIWLRIATPSLAQVAMHQQDLAQIKVQVGAETKGLAFSNTSQRLAGATIDFVLEKVIDASVHYYTPSDLKELICHLDSQVLMWGLACALYPNGHPYRHPCLSDVEDRTCRIVREETLNLHRCLWVDQNALSKTQKTHMAGRLTVKKTEEDIRRYQNEFPLSSGRMISFGNGDIMLKLKLPNIYETEVEANRWIEDLINMTKGAFNEPPHGEQRNRYISMLGQVTTARQYAAYVEGVYAKGDVDGEPTLLGDAPEFVNEVLGSILSTGGEDPDDLESPDNYAQAFLRGIRKYIDDALVAQVSVPSLNCQQCDSEEANRFHERFPHLVPLDARMLFFLLARRKLR